MIACIVRVHDAVEGLAGVVEFPGSSRSPFRTGDELIRSMESWLRDAAIDPNPSGAGGGS